MQSSDKKAKPALKALLAVLIFALAVGLVSLPVMSVYINGQSVAENDIYARNHYAGTLDTIFIGGSQMEYGVSPAVIDAACGTSSYNISCVWQNLYAENLLMEHELSRNPVKHVYIGVCLDTLSRDDDNDDGQGEIITIPRLSGLKTKIDYMLHSGQLSDLPVMYYYYMHYGFIELIKQIKGTNYGMVNLENRGFVPYLLPQQDMTFDLGGKISVDDYTERGITAENREQFTMLVNRCLDAGAEVTVIATPLSDVFLGYYDGWQKYLDEVKELCTEITEGRSDGSRVDIADFNLYKGRTDIFNDETDFYNWNHLNASGAAKFSEILAKYMAKEPDLFYNNYSEMFKGES